MFKHRRYSRRELGSIPFGYCFPPRELYLGDFLFWIHALFILCRAYATFDLEDLGKVVIVGNSAQGGNFVNGKIGCGEQAAGVGESAFFNIFRRRGAEILVTCRIDLVS